MNHRGNTKKSPISISRAGYAAVYRVYRMTNRMWFAVVKQLCHYQSDRHVHV